jgi:hypothetical protein
MTDITAARSKIIALRNAHLGSQAVRSHCNLSLKQIDNFDRVDPADRPMLAGLIRQTMTELSNLLPGEK